MSTPNPPQPPDAYPQGGGAPQAQPPGQQPAPDSSRGGAVTTGVLVALIALALALGGVLGWLVSQSSSSDDTKTVTLTHNQTHTITTTGEPTTDVSTETETETVTAEPVTVTVTGTTTTP